jgi:release factor glutamine methyltransferase
MKVKELIEKLDSVGVQDAKNEAYLILESVFGLSRADILLNREREYESDRLEQIIRKREEKIPLQYIFGEWYFMGNAFLVSPDCLIPRPDTEVLVYEAIKLLKAGGSVADLCTGSGCIGLSLLKARQDIKEVTLADISKNALRIAEENAKRLGAFEKTKIAYCDVTMALPDGKFDMIVSNPPYIPRKDIDGLSEEVKKEPMLALDGGIDGLDIIKSLLEKCPDSLLENGFFLMEFGYDQAEQISHLMDEKIAEGKYKSYKILKDYGGNSRVLVAQI